MRAGPASSTQDSPLPRRRWFQFRLRTLLIGVLLLSVCLSGYVWLRERARRQAKAVATLREMGVYVIYESDASETGEESMVPWRRWESGSDLISRDFFENVVGVTAGEFDKNGPNPLPLPEPRRFWNAVRELPALKGVSVIDQVTPEDLRVLQNHRDLESLYIQTDRVSDEYLREIGRLEGLRDLIVDGDWVSRRQAQISHVGIDHLASLPHLRGLVLCNTTVDDRAAKSLAKLDKLEILILVATNLSDEGLAQLSPLKNLARINVSSSRVTKAGSDAFQAAMPNCEVQNFVPKE